MNVSKLTDEELVVKTRETDSEFYSYLVKRYQEKLYRYIMRLINRDEDARDITQNTFIKAFVNLHRFDSKLKFSSWIYRIAHNESVNFLKKNSRVIHVDDDSLSKLKDETKDSVEELITKERVDKLEKCLKEIPIKYREPLVLFYLEEKSYEEISDILRTPTNTVGTFLHRGKKMMKIICKRKNI